MKKLLFTMIHILCCSAFATGQDRGNGGDLKALEFVAFAQKVVRFLESDPKTKLDLNRLREAIRETKVESTDQNLSLNGIPKDALNFPSEKRILFNRQKWAQASSQGRPSLVLHEYLGIMKIDDANYKYSSALLGHFKYYNSFLECKLNNGTGRLNLGVDEAGTTKETLLLGAELENENDILQSALLPIGTFDEMITEGFVSLSVGMDPLDPESRPIIKGADLVSLRRLNFSDKFLGYYAHKDSVYPVTCNLILAPGEGA